MLVLGGPHRQTNKYVGEIQTQSRGSSLGFTYTAWNGRRSGAKGKYVQKVAVSSTMGPGVKIDTAEIAGA